MWGVGFGRVKEAWGGGYVTTAISGGDCRRDGAQWRFGKFRATGERQRQCEAGRRLGEQFGRHGQNRFGSQRLLPSDGTPAENPRTAQSCRDNERGVGIPHKCLHKMTKMIEIAR